MAKKRVVIVGGVAGGATCAARLRRLDEDAEIVILDRGYYVSFANCGLPYFVGNVIQQESALLLASPELLRERFNIEVRTRNEAMAIDRQGHRDGKTPGQSWKAAGRFWRAPKAYYKLAELHSLEYSFCPQARTTFEEVVMWADCSAAGEISVQPCLRPG